MGRSDLVTIEGRPVTLAGGEVKVGQKAPGFKVMTRDLKEVDYLDFKDKVKVIASVPSLDTPVCDLQIKRFNDEVAAISDDVVVIFISMDLPFAQKRFCDANKITKVKTFSDYRDAIFGVNYGVLIKDLRLLSRAVFIIDKEDNVRYVEYVNELTQHPDYDSALKALKEVVGA